MSLLPTAEEVAARASLELLAMQLFQDECAEVRLLNVDRSYKWIELTIEDRNEYRKLAESLLQKEYAK